MKPDYVEAMTEVFIRDMGYCIDNNGNLVKLPTNEPPIDYEKQRMFEKAYLDSIEERLANLGTPTYEYCDDCRYGLLNHYTCERHDR